jgi:hypothetical protein
LKEYNLLAGKSFLDAGAEPGMGKAGMGKDKEWIDSLAQEIKKKNREAAEEYGRQQHYAGIIAAVGVEFFHTLALAIQEDVDALRSRLQGDPTSAETSVQTVKADEIKITRARFPWVDARLTHRGDTITLDYAKDAGVQGDARLDRKTRNFEFQVAQDDSLYVQDAFADPPQRYVQAEELARQITEILFSA